jgi:Peptidase_C39 like family
MADVVESFVEYQKDRLRAYLDPSIKELSLPTTTYFSQRDNFTQPSRTCNSSSNAMYLDWLLACTKGKRLGGDDGYLEKVLSIGDTTDHWTQTAAIKAYGYSTKWVETKTINQRRELELLSGLLTTGIPVVVNIAHRGSRSRPTGGHVIMLVGASNNDYLCQDPYGTLESSYTDTNGRLNSIDKEEFLQRWQGGYRILK